MLQVHYTTIQYEWMKESIFNSLIYWANSNSYFFLPSSSFFWDFFKTLSWHKWLKWHKCVWVIMGGRVQVFTAMRSYAWLHTGVSGCAQVRICVWDEFSEYLLETRFLTSANYNTHPLRIFFIGLWFCCWWLHHNLWYKWLWKIYSDC